MPFDIDEFLNSESGSSPSSMEGTMGSVPMRAGTNAPVDINGLASAMARVPDQTIHDLAAQQQAQYLKENQMGDVPLDTETGASSWQRFMLSFMREQENQVKYLQKQYGDENVRLDTTGDLIVRARDPDTGKDRDIKVHEKGMSAKDFIDLAGTVPEIAASIVAIRKGRSVPALSKLGPLLGMQRDIALGAAGAEGIGATKDTLANLSQQGLEGVDLQSLGDIAKDRAKQGVTDMMLGEATYGAGRVLKKMQSPFASSRGELEELGEMGKQHWQPKVQAQLETEGLNPRQARSQSRFPTTIGESTGSPMALRTEAYQEELPGGSSLFQGIKKKQKEYFARIQRILMGKEPEGDEQFAQRMADELGGVWDQSQAGVQQAREALQKTATTGIEDVVSGLTIPQRQVMLTQTGKSVRDAVVSKRNAVKAEADKLFEDVRNLPGGEGKVFEAGTLQENFKKIQESLPSVEKTTQVPTGIVDERGVPILRTTKGEEILKEFVPPNILARVNSVLSLKDAKFSLSDLQQMRREVYDDISKSEGVPGLGTHYLNDLGKALTSAIDDGVSKLPTGQLKAALTAANEHYKNKVVPFNRIGLTELFRDASEGGFVPDDRVISRLFKGDNAIHNYQLMKETLTPTSPEFVKLKRAMADHILEKSRSGTSDFIDPEKFISNMTAFKGDAREIADDVFGPQFNKMIRMAKVLKAGDLSSADKQAAGLGGSVSSKVSGSEFLDLMRDSNPTVAKLNDLIKAEQLRDRLYKNGLMKATADGRLPGGRLEPKEFINRFLYDSTPSEMKQVMAIASQNPQTLQEIRAKTIETILNNAARPATPADLSKILSKDVTSVVDSTMAARQLKGDMIDKVEEILGPEISNDFKQYLHLMNPSTKKTLTYKAAGGIAAGAQVATLSKTPLKYLDHAIHNFIVGTVLTKGPLLQWMTSHPASSEPQNALLLLSNPYFVENVIKEFGQGAGSEEVVGSMRRGLSEWWNREGSKQQKPQGVGPIDVFLNSPERPVMNR